MRQNYILFWTLIFLSSIYTIVADFDAKEDTLLPHENGKNVASDVVSVQANKETRISPGSEERDARLFLPSPFDYSTHYSRHAMNLNTVDKIGIMGMHRSGAPSEADEGTSWEFKLDWEFSVCNFFQITRLSAAVYKYIKNTNPDVVFPGWKLDVVEFEAEPEPCCDTNNCQESDRRLQYRPKRRRSRVITIFRTPIVRCIRSCPRQILPVGDRRRLSELPSLAAFVRDEYNLNSETVDVREQFRIDVTYNEISQLLVTNALIYQPPTGTWLAETYYHVFRPETVQKWIRVTQYFQLRSSLDSRRGDRDLCLQPKFANTYNGNRITLVKCESTRYSQFWMIDSENGKLMNRSKRGKFCMRKLANNPVTWICDSPNTKKWDFHEDRTISYQWNKKLVIDAALWNNAKVKDGHLVSMKWKRAGKRAQRYFREYELWPDPTPTLVPSPTPTSAPTKLQIATSSPSDVPTDQPTRSPSHVPTSQPTHSPSNAPSLQPTNSPTNQPTNSPSNAPTDYPTTSPTPRSTIGAWSKVGDTIIGENGARSGYSLSLSFDGSRLVVGEIFKRRAIVYSKEINLGTKTWLPLGSELYESSIASFGFSTSISSDGNVVAVGSPYYSGNQGAVKVYRFTGNAWVQHGSSLIGTLDGDYFGWSIGLSAEGKTLVIGAIQLSGAEERRGYANIYSWNAGWIYKERFIGIGENHCIGYVAISSDDSTIAVGSVRAEMVLVFKKSEDKWAFASKINAPESASSTFGQQIAISSDGNILAIGDRSGVYDRRGQVFAYKYLDGGWRQAFPGWNGVVVAKGIVNTDFFGHSVAMSADGSRIAATIGSFNGREADARIFHFDGLVDWVERSDGIDEIVFGTVVALSGDGKTLALSDNRDSGRTTVYEWI